MDQNSLYLSYENGYLLSENDGDEAFFDGMKRFLSEIKLTIAKSLDSNEDEYQDRDGIYKLTFHL